MRQKVIKNQYFDIKISNTKEVIENFKNFVAKHDCPELVIDLSSLNVIDATKVMILSSTYHFQKYPSGKLKCKVPSSGIRDVISAFIPKNLELV